MIWSVLTCVAIVGLTCSGQQQSNGDPIGPKGAVGTVNNTKLVIGPNGPIDMVGGLGGGTSPNPVLIVDTYNKYVGSFESAKIKIIWYDTDLDTIQIITTDDKKLIAVDGGEYVAFKTKEQSNSTMFILGAVDACDDLLDGIRKSSTLPTTYRKAIMTVIETYKIRSLDMLEKIKHEEDIKDGKQ